MTDVLIDLQFRIPAKLIDQLCSRDAGLHILRTENSMADEAKRCIRDQLRAIIAANGGDPFHPCLRNVPRESADAPACAVIAMPARVP